MRMVFWCQQMIAAAENLIMISRGLVLTRARSDRFFLKSSRCSVGV